MTLETRAGYCAILGRPNVGKSTLLNRLVGHKLAITSHKPQTTRHSILGISTLPGGQVVYVDTPGIHAGRDHAMSRYLNRTAKSVVADVDLVLFVVEAGAWTAEDEAVMEAVVSAGVPSFLVVNKVDRLRDRRALLDYLRSVAAKHGFLEVFPVSARRGENLPRLQEAVLEAMPAGPPLFPEDQLSDRSERFFAAELVREQLTRRYAREIPYALTVEIEKFEDEGDLYRIAALVWVEREGQKNIIIGKGGAALKEAATRARVEMERFFGRKVFLEVWVKVKASWSSDEGALARLGYGD